MAKNNPLTAMTSATTERLYQHLLEESVPDEAAGCRVVQKYIKWIARALHVSARTVQRHLRQLEALGWIRVEEDFFDHGGHRANRYLLVKERALGKPDPRSGPKSPGETRPDPSKTTGTRQAPTASKPPSDAPTQKASLPQVRSDRPPAPSPPDASPPEEEEALWERAFLERLQECFPREILRRTMAFSEARLYLPWWFEERWEFLDEYDSESLYRWLASQGGWRPLREWFLLLERRWRGESE